MSLSPDDRRDLLGIARDAIRRRLGLPPLRPPDLPRPTAPGQGVFVSLHRIDGDLRGCVGCFEGQGPLADTAEQMAVQAAFRDPRFPPLGRAEIDLVRLDLSVLAAPEPLDGPEGVEIGRHGLIVTRGARRGVLLPQVAAERAWDPVTFLEHTCLKAGLAPDAWRDPETRLERFDAEVFGEADPPTRATAGPEAPGRGGVG